jgi:uncharacterized protein YndB with AHSA1/START domain
MADTARKSQATMEERTIRHDTFTIERSYSASPSKVFAAWSDPVAKRTWFVEGDGWDVESYEQDFRIGGQERSSFRFKDGPLISNDTTYLDIVPNRRIVVAYTMAIEGKIMSASLATTEFETDGKGTRLILTEHDAHLDGIDKSGSRKSGCAGLLVKLGQYLDAAKAA